MNYNYIPKFIKNPDDVFNSLWNELDWNIGVSLGKITVYAEN